MQRGMPGARGGGPLGRPRSLAVAIVVAVVAAALLLALIASEDRASGQLTVRSDNQEKGDPALGSDRIRITPSGLWTKVFWVRLDDLARGEEILSRVNIQLTWCRPSDRTSGSGSSCEGTAPYGFSPTIEWRLVLAREQGSSGSPAGGGTPIGRRQRMVCTAKVHHCVPVAFGELEVGARDQGDRYVVLEVRARDERARPCRPAVPRRCNVLQLSQDEGRLGVVREADSELTPSAKRSSKERVRRLRVAGTTAQKGALARVIYSQEFDRPGPLLVKGRLDASFDTAYPVPPLVSKSLVLADSPTSTEGATIEPQNGENCQGSCSYLQPGVMPCLTEADIEAGRRYVNLVAFSARESAFARTGRRVGIEDGGYLATRQYAAELAPEAC